MVTVRNSAVASSSTNIWVLSYRFNAHWNVIAQAAHSSHANLCDGPNDGMTRAGLQIGYKF